MSALLQLAERCEKATGPDRELDLRIEAAVNPEYEGMTEEHARFLVKYGGQRRFTESLDAAMQLVPEGWWVQYLGQRANPDAWAVRVESQSASIPASSKPLYAATAALAICAAALRARAAS